MEAGCALARMGGTGGVIHAFTIAGFAGRLGFSVKRNEHANSTGATYVPPTLRALFLAVKYLINTFLSFFACAVKPAALLFFSSFLIFFFFPLSLSLRFRFLELFSTTMLASSTSEERSNFARYSS